MIVRFLDVMMPMEDYLRSYLEDKTVQLVALLVILILVVVVIVNSYIIKKDPTGQKFGEPMEEGKNDE